MLRSLDEMGGVGIYSRFLIQHLITLDTKNTYLLFYKNPANIGKYRHHQNVEEYFLPFSNKFLWDQIAVPYAAAKRKADVILNPKFSLPLFTSRKCIVVQHGADWFLPEYSKFYKKTDVLYNKIFIPLFCRKADFVISVSEFATKDFIKYVKVPPRKIRTIYFGPAEFFSRVSNRRELERVKKKYNLPDKYIFTLSRYGFGGGNRKNIRSIFEAYKIYSEQSPNPAALVIGGKNVAQYIKDFNLEEERYLQNIHFTGWIEQEDLPAMYSMSELYLYPSNLETFPIPLTEAMACGTPIITSDVNGLKEIAGDAALFINNKDPQEIASAVQQILNNFDLRNKLSQQGLQRSKLFNWKSCAEEFLSILNQLTDQRAIRSIELANEKKHNSRIRIPANPN